jgi:hypothetical protein
MKKVLILTCLMCILLGFAIMFTTSIADAQKKPAGSGADKELATKKGVGDSLGTKEYDKDKLPTKPKIFFGVGSIVLAIIVVKWL